MSNADSSTRLETASLVGDAALFSAVLVFAAPLCVILGPAAAWFLRHRRCDRHVVVSGLLGLLGALVSAGLIVGMITLYAGLVRRLDVSDLTGGIVLLVVFATLLFFVAIALDVGAVRDLAGPRIHVGLDVARLASTLILVAGSVALVIVQAANPSSEVGDAGPFALLFAAIGALTVFFGNALLYRIRTSEQHRRPT